MPDDTPDRLDVAAVAPHPDDLEKTRAAFARVVRGETEVAVVEKRYLHIGGHVVWSRSRLSLLRDAQGEARSCVAVVADITDLKEIQFLKEERDAKREEYERWFETPASTPATTPKL